MTPAIIIAIALKNNRKFLHLAKHYFRLRKFIDIGADKAPTPAPIGTTPMRNPIITGSPAVGPKN